MLDVVEEVIAPWPVRWNVVNKQGEIVEQTVTLDLLRIDAKEFNEIFNGPAPDSLDAMYAHSESAFRRVVRGWSGVLANGKPLPFEEQNWPKLIYFPGFAGALSAAYTRFFFAQAEDRGKNSDTSPAGGPATAAPTPATP